MSAAIVHPAVSSSDVMNNAGESLKYVSRQAFLLFIGKGDPKCLRPGELKVEEKKCFFV